MNEISMFWRDIKMPHGLTIASVARRLLIQELDI